VVLAVALNLVCADAVASLAQGSLLGLQRSTKLGRAVVTEDEDPKLATAKKSVVATIAMSKDVFPEAAQLSDVSLLGLQRSAKIIRKSKASPDTAARPSESTSSRQDVKATRLGSTSLLGLQRSTDLSKGSPVTED